MQQYGTKPPHGQWHLEEAKSGQEEGRGEGACVEHQSCDATSAAARLEYERQGVFFHLSQNKGLEQGFRYTVDDMVAGVSRQFKELWMDHTENLERVWQISLKRYTSSEASRNLEGGSLRWSTKELKARQKTGRLRNYFRKRPRGVRCRARVVD